MGKKQKKGREEVEVGLNLGRSLSYPCPKDDRPQAKGPGWSHLGYISGLKDPAANIHLGKVSP